MQDIYINGYQVNRDRPILIKGLPVHPFCKGGPCKELLEKGEDTLLQERGKEYDEMFAGWSA